MKRPPIPIIYFATAMSAVSLGDSLLYAILPSYYPQLGFFPIQVGILLSVNRWIRLASNHTAEFCYRRYPSDLWLILAFLMGSVVTAVYGTANLFIIFLGARILWGISFSFLRQAGVMTAASSGSPTHITERVGYYRGINALWRTLGLFVGGMSHDAFGFTVTLVSLSILSLVALPLGILSQRGVQAMKKKPVKNVSEKRNIGVACCGFTSSFVGGGMIISTLGLILKEQVGESFQFAGHFIGVVTLTGFMLGLRYFIAGVGSPFLGAMVDGIGRQKSAPFLFLLNAVTLIVAATLSKPLLLVFLMVAFFACATAISILLASQAVGNGTRSLASLVTATDLGMSIGPLLGWSFAQFSLPTNFIFVFGSGIYVIGTIIAFKTFGAQTPSQNPLG